MDRVAAATAAETWNPARRARQSRMGRARLDPARYAQPPICSSKEGAVTPEYMAAQEVQGVAGLPAHPLCLAAESSA